MLLADTRLKHLKPSSKDLNLSDGRGTQRYSRVKPNGLKTFIFRYSYHGRASNISLGKYPATTLKAARAKATEYKSLLADGINPVAYRAKQQQANQMTFAYMANEWLVVKCSGDSPDYKKQVISKINNLAVSREQYNETLLETIRHSKHVKTPKQIAMEKIKCGIGTAEDASIVLGHKMITAEWNKKEK